MHVIILMVGASKKIGMKIFFHLQSDKYLEYYYYRCGSGWGRKCLHLSKAELVAGGPGAFALGPSAQ